MLLVCDCLQSFILNQTCITAGLVTSVVDGETFRSVYKLCIQLGRTELVVVQSGVKLACFEHVAEVIVEVEEGKHICLLLLTETLFSISLPYLLLKHSKNTLRLLLCLDCCKYSQNGVTLLDVKPLQSWCG